MKKLRDFIPSVLLEVLIERHVKSIREEARSVFLFFSRGFSKGPQAEKSIRLGICSAFLVLYIEIKFR